MHDKNSCLPKDRQPDLEQRVAELEKQVQELNDTLRGFAMLQISMENRYSFEHILGLHNVFGIPIGDGKHTFQPSQDFSNNSDG